MNKNGININQESFSLLTSNISPSFKILNSPIMATLKAETCSCFTCGVTRLHTATSKNRVLILISG